MNHKYPFNLTPINFLQTFVVHSAKVAGQIACTSNDDQLSYIEYLGLAASSCFESVYRQHNNLDKKLSLDDYSELIVGIKNQIGGRFSRASSTSGVVRVVSTRCPFGDAVKEAPELCRMTSSVFGGIAARNFGYAKVNLSKRIALNDGMCEVCIYTDKKSARQYEGDEYEVEDGAIVAKPLTANVAVRVEEGLQKFSCHTLGNPPEDKRSTSVVAESASMRAVINSIEMTADTEASIQITGETGVGKEWVARAIHGLSSRWQESFVAVNCGAIPENLIESALFGHEKGAFTGANNTHNGYFERANDGTLFLDEIDAMPLLAQAKLLRVLQEGQYERVGGRQTLNSNARIISASNRCMKELVDAGEIRQDLFYRLSVVPIDIPPLRERLDDLSPLVSHFLRQLSDKYHTRPKVLSDGAWMKAMAYDWPGNVRELENILERAFLFSRGQVIEDLDIMPRDPDPASEADDFPPENLNLRSIKKQASMDLERKIIHAGLRRYSGNISDMARAMGITPRAVHQKLKAHQITPSDYRGN